MAGYIQEVPYIYLSLLVTSEPSQVCSVAVSCKISVQNAEGGVE